MTYQFIKEFENNYKTIYNEYLTIKNNVYPWPEPELHGGGWDVFGLYLGSEYDYVTKQTTAQLDMNNCPFTRKLIKDNIPAFIESLPFKLGLILQPILLSSSIIRGSLLSAYINSFVIVCLK